MAASIASVDTVMPSGDATSRITAPSRLRASQTYITVGKLSDS